MIIIHDLTMLFESQTTLISVPQGGQCGECRSLHHLFVNRNGKTLCSDCDHERVAALASNRREHVLAGGNVPALESA